jgi:DNA ligase-1
MIGSTLYTTDSKGKTRWWKMEQDGPRFRTVSGLLDGKAVESEWTECFPKNVGRANATTAEEQCSAEILSLYTKKLDRKYHTAEDFRDAGSSAGYKFPGPMLATKYESFPGPCYSQPKLDGYRSTADANAGLLSRQGKPWRHDHILDALAPVFAAFPGIVLDGELYNHDLKDDFNELGSLIKKDKRTPEQDAKTREVVQYHVYDILSHPGTFIERIHVLREILDELGDESPVKFVRTDQVGSEDELNELYASYMEDGYEGQMVRLQHTLYEGNGKRSKGLMKRKEFFDEEYEVIEVHEGKGNWAGHAKAVTFRMPDGRMTENGEHPKAGIKGTKEFAKELLTNWRKYEGVTIRSFIKTPAGIPRFGVAYGWHESLEFRG